MIITQKQFPNYKKYEIMYEGRPLSMEVGKLAELCNSAVLVKYGETTVLVTCTASARPKDGIDYFPLSVDFNEKLYAVGRIPGSFMRREGKPSLPAVLASRLIDRPMRPLFPTDLRNDVVIACEVLSVDRDCSPEITAMIGASAAVSISDVPFNGPIAGIVLGWDGEKYLFNPTQEQRKTNRMTTTIAATHKKIVMIESEADQVPDDVMYEGIVQAHEHLIHNAAEVAGERAHQHPDAAAQQHGGKCDHSGGARALQHAAENVPPEVVGSHQMGKTWGRKLGRAGNGRGVVGRPEKAQQDQRRHHAGKNQPRRQIEAAVHPFFHCASPPRFSRGSMRRLITSASVPASTTHRARITTMTCTTG